MPSFKSRSVGNSQINDVEQFGAAFAMSATIEPKMPSPPADKGDYPRENKTFEKRHGKGHKHAGYRHHFYLDALEPLVKSEDVPAPPASTVLSTASIPDGGKIISVRNPEGKIQVRIEYEREQIMKLAASPFAILPPACIRDIVANMPELIASFPVRHCFA